jgi:two-component system OmpR family response regulator
MNFRVSPEGGTAMKRILVADDEVTICDMLEEILRPLGEVTCVHTGREVYALLTTCRDLYDVCVCDVMMPDWGGDEAVELIRGLGVSTPVIFISGHLASSLSLPSGCTLLTKPFAMHHLIDTVKKVMR